ncbi:MAG: hypothetical protein IJA13_04420, partial [Clostridia bacterium]|nr:hypothetical protein [Clostridia bacterium]
MLKTKIKRLISVILSVTLLFSVFSVDVFANEYENSSSFDTYLLASYNARANSNAALKESLTTQLKSFKSSINIYSFKIPYTNENVQKLCDILIGELPECFHIELGFSYSISNGYISEIYPSYSYTKAEYDLMLAKCEAAADEMLEGVEGNVSLSDREKLLILHDRIATSCDYDYENYLMGNIPAISYTMYGVLVNNRAVCQGYALAYSYLLNRIGIE